MPHYLQDRRKFQRYSLADVDTSERSNTAAAFSFLNSQSNAAPVEPAADIRSGSGVVKFKPRKAPAPAGSGSNNRPSGARPSQGASREQPKPKRRGKLLDVRPLHTFSPPISASSVQ